MLHVLYRCTAHSAWKHNHTFLKILFGLRTQRRIQGHVIYLCSVGLQHFPRVIKVVAIFPLLCVKLTKVERLGHTRMEKERKAEGEKTLRIKHLALGNSDKQWFSWARCTCPHWHYCILPHIKCTKTSHHITIISSFSSRFSPCYHQCYACIKTRPIFWPNPQKRK